jgi:hypothetical protein
MNWTALLYVTIIALLYIPLVFLGANVMFPDSDADCYPMVPRITESVPVVDDVRDDCYKAQQVTRKSIEGHRYVLIALANLFVLLTALFLTMDQSMMLGLFLGSTLATFFATINYFDTTSTWGFGVLLVTFIIVLIFIGKKKDSIFLKKKK